jgi:Rps23 Pro-64 3,4-dihydroxylase Tpa1-like proline 4-hydroxylase
MTHKIIVDAIPRSLCLAAEAAWPDQFWPFWHRYNGATANKYGSMDRSRIPAACLAALDALALAVVPFIGESFIDYDLHGAGMHLSLAGGFLKRHLDAERHPIRRWERTHSIVLCVSSEWEDRYGGQMVIEGQGTFTPRFGTALIFETRGAVHEVKPVADDAPVGRKTLALFGWKTSAMDEGSTSAIFL